MVSLEVCANSATSAIAAQNGGAARVELCNNLYQGGITPSHGHILVARKHLHIKLYTLIRPRSGDFLYTKEEFQVMLSDVRQSIALGCDGIVVGILNKDGSVDMERNSQIVNMARQHGLGVTFHRAFDVCADKEKALEDLIHIGFERLLTSGGKSNVIEGARNVKNLLDQANGRISIMPGGGISEKNVADLVHYTGVKEIHSSARALVNSQMEYRNDSIMMGTRYVDEYAIYETSPKVVQNLIRLANSVD
ncbi:copper homeostasis protein CutC [Mucilaginibacter boryungensis]|uniref:PF03932 family protein CutC n=1 Tax=Mucilaginibacter boryungensis TaxID=768480 RepID=A0ABR9XH72_9SPHI|nr:copper homeostasis protein CutC [Mucilaginibacter boryungensis]MBE9666532.1 copper homeostasis protein CutC [Mucilaginibacter boryungensis]